MWWPQLGVSVGMGIHPPPPCLGAGGTHPLDIPIPIDMSPYPDIPPGHTHPNIPYHPLPQTYPTRHIHPTWTYPPLEGTWDQRYTGDKNIVMRLHYLTSHLITYLE